VEKKETKIIVEVKSQNFNKEGQVVNALEAGAKLTKANAGRVAFENQDSITFHASGCGCPKVNADYTSTAIGEGEVETVVELDVKAKKLDMDRKELIDAIAANAKLTKADGGRDINQKTEDWFRLKAESNCEGDCGTSEGYYTTKTTEIKA
jgi:hypothetical protein